MDLTTFLVTVFCLIDDWLAGQPLRLRQRGPRPTLADSEVLTIECVGEFLGIDTDTGLYEYFRRHWADWFPALGRVHRTSFVRQAAKGVGGQAPPAATPAHPGRLRPAALAGRQRGRADLPLRPCRSLPTAAGAPPPGATMRSPSRPTLGCAPICGCAGQA